MTTDSPVYVDAFSTTASRPPSLLPPGVWTPFQSPLYRFTSIRLIGPRTLCGKSLNAATLLPQGRAEAGKSGLFIVPSAGGEPKPISEFEEGRTFDLEVSPDGKMLGYTRFKKAGNLWLIQNALPKL